MNTLTLGYRGNESISERQNLAPLCSKRREFKQTLKITLYRMTGLRYNIIQLITINCFTLT